MLSALFALLEVFKLSTVLEGTLEVDLLNSKMFDVLDFICGAIGIFSEVYKRSAEPLGNIKSPR